MTHLETPLLIVYTESITGRCELERLDILVTSINALVFKHGLHELNWTPTSVFIHTDKVGIQLGMAINEPPSAQTSHSEWDLTWLWVSLM